MQVQTQSVRDPAYLATLEARFALAARHSRRVKFLRLAVPVAMAVALVGLVAISVLNPLRLLAKLPIDIGNVVISGTAITMESPHIAGFTNDRRPYSVWAQTARQNLTDPSKVELQALKGKVQMEDASTITLDAKQGNFNNNTQILHLQDNVHLQTSTGYEAFLTDALVDMNKGTVVSEQPVRVKLLNGNLTSQRLEIVDSGALVTFEGNVSMDLVPQGADNPAAKSATNQ